MDLNPGYDDWRHRDGVYILCRKCGHGCGSVLHGDSILEPCERHGPLQQPTEREIAKAVAKWRATDHAVALRVWPVGA